MTKVEDQVKGGKWGILGGAKVIIVLIGRSAGEGWRVRRRKIGKSASVGGFCDLFLGVCVCVRAGLPSSYLRYSTEAARAGDTPKIFL